MSQGQCVLKETARVRGSVTPWHHENPIDIAIPAGKAGTFLQDSIVEGVAMIEFHYPRHTVIAHVPKSAVDIS